MTTDLADIAGRYSRDGYAVVRGAVPAPLLAELKRHIERRLTQLGGRDTADLNPNRVTEKDDPFLVHVASEPGLVDLVQSVLGPDIVLWSYGYILKSPTDPQPVLWHQDASYWRGGLDPVNAVTLYVAIGASTRENGCLRVIPGSHKLAVQELVPRTDVKNFLNSSMNEAPLETSRAVDVLLEPGDISIHHPGLIHCSEAAKPGCWRYSFVINYVAASVRIRAKPFPLRLVRGQAVAEAGNEYAPLPRFHPERHMEFAGCERFQ